MSVRDDVPDLELIQNTLQKMYVILSSHNSICVGVSGGSDSNIIVHMIAKHFREFLPNIHFVFLNTGIEYRATIKHLLYIEEQYNIHIDRIRGRSVVSACRDFGIPILSKQFSHKVPQAQRGSAIAMELINGTAKAKDGSKSRFNFPKKHRDLAMYIIEHGIKVSDRCCDVSKKDPLHKYQKSIQADLEISGERQAEGGIRSYNHKGCFEQSSNRIDKYMPLWLWSDATKQYYKESEGIVYSDCYEVYGLKRTGCVGCPFSSHAGEELEILKKYEPNLYKACMHVFGESYRLMDMFGIRKEKIIKDQEPE